MIERARVREKRVGRVVKSLSCFPLMNYNISCKIRSQCIVDNYDDDDDDEQRVERVC